MVEFVEMFHEGKDTKMKVTSMMVVSMLAMPVVFAATNEADVAYYQVVKNDTGFFVWKLARITARFNKVH